MHMFYSSYNDVNFTKCKIKGLTQEEGQGNILPLNVLVDIATETVVYKFETSSKNCSQFHTECASNLYELLSCRKFLNEILFLSFIKNSILLGGIMP
jgi:hypothetical protein